MIPEDKKQMSLKSFATLLPVDFTAIVKGDQIPNGFKRRRKQPLSYYQTELDFVIYKKKQGWGYTYLVEFSNKVLYSKYKALHAPTQKLWNELKAGLEKNNERVSHPLLEKFD